MNCTASPHMSASALASVFLPTPGALPGFVSLTMYAACGVLWVVATRLRRMMRELQRERDEKLLVNQHLEELVRSRTQVLDERSAALERANVELRRLDQLRADLLGNVSHELRTPLTSIRAIIETLREDGHELSNEQRDEFLGIVQKQTERLIRLILGLIDASQMEAGTFVCEPRETAIEPLVAFCVETLRAMATGRGVRLLLDASPGLPAAIVDADRCGQVVFNLVDNAIKFAPPGSSVRVRVFAADKRRTYVGNQAGVEGGAAQPPPGVESDAPAAARYIVVTLAD